jgi:hypothetical protein
MKYKLEQHDLSKLVDEISNIAPSDRTTFEKHFIATVVENDPHIVFAIIGKEVTGVWEAPNRQEAVEMAIATVYNLSMPIGVTGQFAPVPANIREDIREAIRKNGSFTKGNLQVVIAKFLNK